MIWQTWIVLPHRDIRNLRTDLQHLPRLYIVDGGAFDWLATIASNRRAVYVATGTGSQLIALLFRES